MTSPTPGIYMLFLNLPSSTNYHNVSGFSIGWFRPAESPVARDNMHAQQNVPAPRLPSIKLMKLHIQLIHSWNTFIPHWYWCNRVSCPLSLHIPALDGIVNIIMFPLIFLISKTAIIMRHTVILIVSIFSIDLCQKLSLPHRCHLQYSIFLLFFKLLLSNMLI